MNYPEMVYSQKSALALDHFRKMDYFAVNHYRLPIELMMENAGFHLAQLAAGMLEKDAVIRIGVGNGNNGGGGLVAARRLAAWGYEVHLDLFTEITKELPKRQLERALLFGANENGDVKPDMWIDAYLGFSQRLPLENGLVEIIQRANNSRAKKISLDIPTGFLGQRDSLFFQAEKVLTLASPKKILYELPAEVEILIADLGIPKAVYDKFGVEMMPFDQNGIICLKR